MSDKLSSVCRKGDQQLASPTRKTPKTKTNKQTKVETKVIALIPSIKVKELLFGTFTPGERFRQRAIGITGRSTRYKTKQTKELNYIAFFFFFLYFNETYTIYRSINKNGYTHGLGKISVAEVSWTVSSWYDQVIKTGQANFSSRPPMPIKEVLEKRLWCTQEGNEMFQELFTFPRRFVIVDGKQRVTGLLLHCPEIETLTDEVQLIDCDLENHLQLLRISMAYNHSNPVQWNETLDILVELAEIHTSFMWQDATSNEFWDWCGGILVDRFGCEETHLQILNEMVCSLPPTALEGLYELSVGNYPLQDYDNEDEKKGEDGEDERER
jgi:hypothetical protein